MGQLFVCLVGWLLGWWVGGLIGQWVGGLVYWLMFAAVPGTGPGKNSTPDKYPQP